MPVKRSYSFTGDLRIYETCPRQYQFFREYNFTPSRSAVIFFRPDVPVPVLERCSPHRRDRERGSIPTGPELLRPEPGRDAPRHTDRSRRSLENDGYILTGKVDLLLGGDGKLELLDFKTSPRP